MKLLTSISVSGAVLAVALLLCLVIESSTVRLIIWLACAAYGLVTLAVIPSLVAEHRRSMQELRRKLGL